LSPALSVIFSGCAYTADWKKPTDSKGWFRLGHAIRLAYQLDLHLPRRNELPKEEFKARLQLDRERTWICMSTLENLD